ncbi:unnamed protein product [Chondrus crispus]|uniref:Uncharacterized protein n=1 Tax=Chondrus crispus TaxID=2769 RepID=R7QAU5_CHOCR|nr:unnamed protein product [Chondrus crispus]CDF34580.1 unnamed protein product [Chondrus crispus]|eukprot:XP_005714399.1 unnamed protein product [Chondrus crispus]
MYKSPMLPLYFTTTSLPHAPCPAPLHMPLHKHLHSSLQNSTISMKTPFTLLFLTCLLSISTSAAIRSVNELNARQGVLDIDLFDDPESQRLERCMHSVCFPLYPRAFSDFSPTY